MKYLSLILLIPITITSCTSRSHNLKNNTLIINNEKLNIEVADTNIKISKGLMHRKNLEKNSGMLFIFKSEQTLSFWMENTLIPLSIAYLNKDCTIVDIQKMKPHKKGTVHKYYKSKFLSLYAIEVNKYWFEKNNIKIGDKVTKGSGKFNFCN